MDTNQLDLVVSKMVTAINQITEHIFRADKLISAEEAMKINMQYIPGTSPNIQLSVETSVVNGTLGVWFAVQTADISVFSYRSEKSIYEWHGVIEGTDTLLSRIEEAVNKILST